MIMGSMQRKFIILPLVIFCCHGMPASLIDSSPFIPPDFKAQTPGDEAPSMTNAAVADQVEFRGFYKVEGEYWFLLAGKGKPDGRWLKIGEENEFVRVLKFDEAQNRLEIRHNAATGWINLKSLPEPAGGQLVVQNNPIQGRSAIPLTGSSITTPSRGRPSVSIGRTRTQAIPRNFITEPGNFEVPKPPSTEYRSREVLAAPEEPPQLSASSLLGNVPNVDLTAAPPPSGRPVGSPPSERPPRGR